MDVLPFTTHPLGAVDEGAHHVDGEEQGMVQLERQWLGLAWQRVDSVPGQVSARFWIYLGWPHEGGDRGHLEVTPYPTPECPLGHSELATVSCCFPNLDLLQDVYFMAQGHLLV